MTHGATRGRRLSFAPLTLTATLGLILSVMPLLLVVVYRLSPASAFHTPAALALSVVLIVVLAGVLLTRDDRSAPFDILVVGMVAAFFLLRIPVLWLAPKQFIYPWAKLEPPDVAWTLLFLTIGTIAAVAGFRLGVGWHPWRAAAAPQRTGRLRLPLARLLMIMTAYFAIEALMWIYLGTASSALSGEVPTHGGLLFMRHFISMYAAMGIGMAIGLDGWRRFAFRDRLGFCASLVLFLVYTLAAGSRSGPITLLIIAMLWLLVRGAKVTVRAPALAVAFAGVVLALMLFPAATMIRAAWFAVSQSGDARLSAPGTSRDEQSWLAAGVIGALNRLNGLDPLLMIVPGKEFVPLDDYVNARQTVKSAVNLLVPSMVFGREPFPGILPTSRLFSLVYRGHPPSYINSWYQTDMWTLWGAAFAIGGWGGGPFIIGTLGAVLGAAYRWLLSRRWRLASLWRLWWLYSCYLVLISYGFDVDLGASASMLVGGTVVVFLLRIGRVPAARLAPVGAGDVSHA